MPVDQPQFSQQQLLHTGSRQCLVQWSLRGERAENEAHAVPDSSTSERICDVIARHLMHLVGEHGWQWTQRHPGLIDIQIMDLGPQACGFAMIDLKDVPYLRLNCRRFAADDRLQMQHLGNVVLHELVHLLQFGTEVWWSWPAVGCIGEDDPNAWLHESVALAAEAIWGEGTAEWYPWLWKWAVAPDRPLDRDKTGTRAAPFLIFLADTYGPKFLSAIYSSSNDRDEPLEATELLDHTIQRHDPDSSCSQAFAQFCAAWMSAELLWSPQAHLIQRIVGRRAFTELCYASETHNCQWRSQTWKLDHLSCRYFSVRNLGSDAARQCQVSILVPDQDAASKLSATAILVSDNDTILAYAELTHSSHGLSGILSQPAQNCHLRLVVVNTAFGPGWALYDDLHFHIECNWSL